MASAVEAVRKLRSVIVSVIGNYGRLNKTAEILEIFSNYNFGFLKQIFKNFRE